MEDTLRGPKLIIKLKADRLNPCSNGRYSQSEIKGYKRVTERS